MIRTTLRSFLAKRSPLAVSFAVLAGSAVGSQAAVINGTSGSNTDTTAYSTTGNLSLSLGFFAEYLIVGGGGGGGGNIGGGGGAGEFVEGTVNSITAQSYAVTVGTGGTGGSYDSSTSGTNGGSSSVFSVTAVGGGGGGTLGVVGLDGGSGGGGGGGGRTGGSSTATSPGLGNLGGTSQPNSGFTDVVAAGGGGAGSAGVANSGEQGGNGGAGQASSITGTSVAYAGGGGGAVNGDTRTPANRSTGPAGTGQAGGGGGGYYSASNATQFGGDGAANSGSGGGGGSNLVNHIGKLGGDGGSGVVIVRYQGAPAATGGNPTAGTGTASGYTLHQFTATGSSALDFTGLDLNTRLGATLTSGITGTGNLTYAGPGTLTLDAANTYSGATAITGGTLAIGASGTIATTPSVTLSSGTTFDVSAASGFTLGASQTLAGTGTVVGNISIAGTHAPGSSPGLQTFDNNLTYNTGANVDWELISNTQSVAAAGTDYDQIAVGGNLDFAGATTLDLIFNTAGSTVAWTDTFWDADRAWLVWDLSTGSVSNLSNLSLNTTDWLDGSSTTLSTSRPNATFSLSQVGQDVNLVYTAVPEPSTLALLGCGAVAAVGFARRRRPRTN